MADTDEKKEDNLPNDNIIKNSKMQFIEKLPKQMTKSDINGFKSALCIIPPSSIWSSIQEIREKHDKAYYRWQPHMNVLYPFIGEQYFESQLSYIQNALSKIKPFEIVYKRFNYFDKGGSTKDSDPICHLFLQPAPADSIGELQKIYDALTGLYPFCSSKKHNQGFAAHLTCAQFTKSKCIENVKTWNDKWTPISFKCDTVCLIARDDDDNPFQIRYTIPLGTPYDAGTSKYPHIYFVIDTTSSMGSYISSLNQVLEQIFRMVRILFAGKVFFHIIGYKDYCDKEIIAECHDNDKIQEWVKNNLRASGGGDWPEATKTALNVLYQHITSTKGDADNSLVLIYTDAPPHHPKTGSSNIGKEKEEIKNKYTYPGFDWIKICQAFDKLNIPFYTFLSQSIGKNTKLFYKMLGEIVEMPNTNSDIITKATIGSINQLMGADDGENGFKYADNFKLLKYENSIENIQFDGLKDEMNCNGLLPGNKNTLINLEKVNFMRIKPLNFLSNVLRNLPKKLLYDEKFRDLVFTEFKYIFTIENILCLSYNSVFGTIWRNLCRFREDDRLKILRDTFGLLIDKLDDDKKKEMQEWIDESYDNTEEINEIITKHLEKITKNDNDNDNDNDTKTNENDEKYIKYVTLDAIDAISDDILPTKKELLTIAHSLYGDIIYKVQNIMTHLIVIKKKISDPAPFDDKVINSYIGIPYSLNNKQFFSLLSHLVIPGTMFTLRPTLIMAMIAYLSGNILLNERSKQLLLENKGKWILLDKLEDFPEFISVPFVKLVIRCNNAMNNELLTDTEIKFYNKLYKLYRVRSTRPKEFEIKIGFTTNIKDINCDFKRKCIACNEYRSFTLMLPDNKCGLCLAIQESEESVDKELNIKEYDDLKDKSKNSHLVSCRTCQGIYAVINVSELNVSPKCHYCRNGVKYENIPVLNCNICLNRWILPNKDFFKYTDDKWMCPVCTNNPNANKLIDTVSASYEKLCELYPILLSKLFNINDNPLIVKELFSSMSLYKLYTKFENKLFLSSSTENKNDDNKEEKKRQEGDSKIAQNVKDVIDILSRDKAKYKGRIIHNIAELIENIFGTTNYGKLSDICCLCFEPKTLITLESACGNCKNLMCFECLKTWYQQLKPGKIVLPSHLLCPFCKQKPVIKTIKKYNKEICYIIRRGKKHEIMELSTSYYYAWCFGCYQIKSAVKRECLREKLPNLNKFKCEQCTEKELLLKSNEANKDDEYIQKTYKKCPSCDSPTVKISGCNHIQCNCGSHWCYQCEMQFDQDIIYDHMDQEHGGMYLDYEVQ